MRISARPFAHSAGILASLLFLGLASPLFALDDFQTWHTVEIVKRLGKRWELFFRPEARIRDDSSTLFYHEVRQGIRFKPCEHLQVGLNYLFVRNESSGKPLEEHTGELDVTPKMTWGQFDLSLRGRAALRTIERSAGEQEVVIRLMPKIAYPTQFHGRKITPYVADDLFYDYTRDAWNQNRSFLGMELFLWEARGVKSSLDLYYMHQTLLGKRRDYSGNHILGTKLNIKF